LEPENAASEQEDATPIFTAYRRGYDPDQVERYVADQRRRLDDATNRASEAERKLAAAVGQLRELHRRVAALESTERTDQVPAIDAIGEHIQRILQDAWDGAHAMRQSAERDAREIREKATQDADGIISKAHTRAEAVGAELARRRQGVLQHIEQERSKAVAQTTFLQGQRKLALSELKKIRSLIDATIVEFTEAPVTASNPPPYVAEFTASAAAGEPQAAPDRSATAEETHSIPTQQELDAVQRRHPTSRYEAGALRATLPVHHLPSREPEMEHDPSSLVRSHREHRGDEPVAGTVHDFDPDRRRHKPSLFDFEAREDT
jgi:cell division septum initiation protein DivIVA